MLLPSIYRLRDVAFALMCITALGACSDDNNTPTPGGINPGSPSNNTSKEAPEGAITYHRDVRPLFDKHCMSCHGDQKRGDLSLAYNKSDWLTGAPDKLIEVIEHVRANGSHWRTHDNSCAPQMLQPRELSEDEIFTLAKWGSDGKWEGEELDYQPGSLLFERPSEEPLITFTIPEYLPDDNKKKNYRCYVLEDALTENTFIKAIELTPGNAQIVDHITLVTVNIPMESAPLLTIDRDNQEPGFECFGQFAQAQQPKILHSWSPGSPSGIALPEGHAFVLPKDARLAIQVHYDPTRVEEDKFEQLDKDISSAKLWKGSQPDTEVRVLPFGNIRIEIPPNAEDHEDVFEFKMPYDGKLLGMTPHMLNFGSSYRFDVIGMDEGATPNPQCLIDIPEWHFSQKQSYQFSSQIQIKQGDVLRQTCRFMNTDAQQPLVNGLPKKPEVVYWGTEPNGSMCLNQVLVGVPYNSETLAVDCSLVDDCIKECGQNDLECFGYCAAQSSGDCTQCAFTELVTCGGSKCGQVGIQLVQCLGKCNLASGYGLFCIEKNCAFEWQEFSNCGIPKFALGLCQLEDCP